jgi:hypothetical protein
MCFHLNLVRRFLALHVSNLELGPNAEHFVVLLDANAIYLVDQNIGIYMNGSNTVAGRPAALFSQIRTKL